MDNTSILLSRNTPLALVIGAAGFIGSHVCEDLLQRGIQVVGVDDLSLGKKENLDECIKEKKFHFIHRSINEPLTLNIQRLDYAFFMADEVGESSVFKKGLENFLKFLKFQTEKESHFGRISEDKKQNKLRVVFVSSTSLYKKELTEHDRALKEAEIEFAKFVRKEKINARIVRVSPTFGPRMHFRVSDAFFRILKAYLNGNVANEETQSDLATRVIYVTDSTSAILKAVFLGSTSHKIFDAAALEPLKVSDIKQILLDPLWFDSLHIEPQTLGVWPTPNLKKTMKELSWRPKKVFLEGLKETIKFFREKGLPEEIKENQIKPEKSEADKPESQSSQKAQSIKQADIPISSDIYKPKEEPKTKDSFFKKLKFPKFRQNIFLIIGLALILFGIIFPILSLGISAFSIRNNVLASREALLRGDFKKANFQIAKARQNVSDMQGVLSSLGILKKAPLLDEEIEKAEKVLNLTQEGIEGIDHSSKGFEALFASTKVISGEEDGQPKELFEKAQLELAAGSGKLSKVSVALADESLTQISPGFLKKRLSNLILSLSSYSDLIEKAKVASYLMPQITGVGDRKVYLVLFQNNMELRPTGGFIGSYGRLEFENGKLKNLKVDDIYNLDGNLKDHIEPPPEIKSDLGQKDWYLRDSNFEPDFPTSARQAEFFYNKEAGERVQGVVALDLTAAGKLIEAVGGLNLSDYSEAVTKENLFENAVKHSESDFFPGSSGKRNYLTSLQNALFNKIFFTSNQNWPAIVASLGEALEQKHMLVYFEDPQVFSYIASQNWAGILPREPEKKEGETQDLLAIVEANLGANKSNYYLERDLKLDTEIGKEYEVYHRLLITYRNNSPSSAFPAGTYKNRLRIYLPAGTKLNRASLNGIDITKELNPLSDYGRTYYSLLVEVSPKQEVFLNFDYTLLNPLSFKDDLNKYRLDIIKQAGTGSDPFEWTLTYPINLKIESGMENSLTSVQEMNLKTILTKDRVFLIDFKKL